jgi:hypothetical protein
VDDHNRFIGLTTLEDLMGSKPVQLQETYHMERKEILVKHLMMPKTELLAIDYKDLEPSKVGHVIKTLHELKRHVLLVTEQTDAHTAPVLRGLLMDTQINKQMGFNIRT